MNFIHKLFLVTTAALSLTIVRVPVAAQTAAADQSAPASGAKKAQTMAAPSAADIADAKAKGLVWVNTSTKVYHKDGAFYGATKHGKFMTEDDANKAGYRAAKTGRSKKSAATPAPAK